MEDPELAICQRRDSLVIETTIRRQEILHTFGYN